MWTFGWSFWQKSCNVSSSCEMASVLAPLGTLGHGHVWPLAPLSYGLFYCGLIGRCSCGTLLGSKAPMTFLIRRKRHCGVAERLTQGPAAALIPDISSFPSTVPRLSFQRRLLRRAAGAALEHKR